MYCSVGRAGDATPHLGACASQASDVLCAVECTECSGTGLQSVLLQNMCARHAKSAWQAYQSRHARFHHSNTSTCHHSTSWRGTHGRITESLYLWDAFVTDVAGHWYHDSKRNHGQEHRPQRQREWHVASRADVCRNPAATVCTHNNTCTGSASTAAAVATC